MFLRTRWLSAARARSTSRAGHVNEENPALPTQSTDPLLFSILNTSRPALGLPSGQKLLTGSSSRFPSIRLWICCTILPKEEMHGTRDRREAEELPVRRYGPPMQLGG